MRVAVSLTWDPKALAPLMADVPMDLAVFHAEVAMRLAPSIAAVPSRLAPSHALVAAPFAHVKARVAICLAPSFRARMPFFTASLAAASFSLAHAFALPSQRVA